jgi:hypothetical protein
MDENVIPKMIRCLQDHTTQMRRCLCLQLDPLTRQTFEWHMAFNDRIVESLLPLL